MMKIITTIISSLLVLSLSAQVAKYKDIYPSLPFSLKKANDLGYIRAIVWIDHYSKAEEDESGTIWSNPVGESYQYEKYAFMDGILEDITRYKPDGFRLMTYEYFYQKGLLAAIDKLSYDSLEESHIDYSYIYFYKNDGTPFQKVKQFPKYRGLRVLHDFTFDEKHRVSREKIIATGMAPKMDSLIGMKPNEKTLVLTGYEKDTKIITTYENMYKIVKTEKIIHNTDSLPMKSEISDTDGNLVIVIDYDYEGDQLVKENHVLPTEDGIIHLKTMFYTYTEDGLIESVIIEKGTMQTVYSYSYAEE
ncbi:MAG: hypothetical protein GY810_24860 [Aureispira sp.]|nr:hypothetical protein [Aureispira sp.]